MAIGWDKRQREIVSDAFRRFPWTENRCAAAARAIFPVAVEVDARSRGLLLNAPHGARFIISKPPKKRYFDHHVLIEAQQHRVDAFTGEDGHDAASYVDTFWDFGHTLAVTEVDVQGVDPGIEQDET